MKSRAAAVADFNTGSILTKRYLKRSVRLCYVRRRGQWTTE